MSENKTSDKERKGSMPAIQDEGYPYRMRMGEIADAIGRSVTIPGNLGVVQLLNTIVELRRELADLRENYEYQRARADHHAARIAGQDLSARGEKDAERYRWLRETASDGEPYSALSDAGQRAWDALLEGADADTIDAAIDAATSGEKVK